MIQTRHNNRSKLNNIPKCPIPLHHKVRRKTQLTSTRGYMSIRRINRLRVISHNSDVVPTSHELPVLTSLAVDIRLEDLHHIFLGIAHLAGGSVAVGGDVERLAVAVQEFDDV